MKYCITLNIKAKKKSKATILLEALIMQVLRDCAGWSWRIEKEKKREDRENHDHLGKGNIVEETTMQNNK